MKKVTIVTSKYFQKNNLFNLNDPWINRDDCMRPNAMLRDQLEKKGINLSTQDINNVTESNLVIFSQTPNSNDNDLIQSLANNTPCFLLISELELIHLNNANQELHEPFSKIFTYQDKLIDNKKYFKLNYSFCFPSSVPKNLATKNKLCMLITANKTLNHPLELYSKRVEAIRWFEKNHPDDFDLYGVGWDGPNYFHGHKLKRAINRSLLLRKLFSKPFRSYKGKVDRKIDTMQNYKFNICYENAYNIPGWITEKIFDCFFAGSIPIYWGADNVTDHIPSNCFIDKRNFSSYKDLYRYLTSMPDSEYLNYIANIENYLNSTASYEFSADYYVKMLTKHIVNELK